MTTTYAPPIDQLLTLGEPSHKGPEAWLDYPSLGLTTEHVPELLRLATDLELNWADGASTEVWAPVHAWRALGQLRVADAVGPLLALNEELGHEDDWLPSELVDVCRLIGAGAVGPLADFLSDPTLGEWPRVDAVEALQAVGQAHADARAECTAVLLGQLERFEENSASLNGYLIGGLLDLDAREALPTIESAFAADRVDVSVEGDWEDVQIRMGLREHRDTPRKLPPWIKSMRRAATRIIQQKDREAAARAKRKKKAAKAARRRNRR